jgi:thioredoxin 1
MVVVMSGEGNRLGNIEVNEGNFVREVLQSPQPTLVAFGAPWSKPCQILQPTLSEIAAQCGGKIRVLRVNVDDNPDLGVWYGIESIPTLLYFVEGKVRARIVGTASKNAILSKLESFDSSA